MLDAARPVLTIANAKFSYGKVHALRGISLELYAGELLGLLGPNGAGKTSLIRCLAGRQTFSSGDVYCDLEGNYRDLIGIVPQEIALYQDLTVRQNLDVFARLQSIPTRELKDCIHHSLEWTQLQDKSRALVRTLSGGMQRRLNIACSVLHRPAILFLDEPTVGVDPQSRERIYTMLDSLLDDGTAILLTTHHLEEAQDRCERIAIIDAGKIIETGSFDELLEKTIGTAQQVRFQFSSRQASVPAPLRLDETGEQAICDIRNVSLELPALLAIVEAANLPVENLSLRSPTLQHMFLHLTGKELRE